MEYCLTLYVATSKSLISHNLPQDEQIATEFKQLARRYHPDKASEVDRAAGNIDVFFLWGGGGVSQLCRVNSAKEMFMKLEKAREVLLDKEKRSKYDQWQSGGFKSIISFEKWLEMHNRVHTVRNLNTTSVLCP